VVVALWVAVLVLLSAIHGAVGSGYKDSFDLGGTESDGLDVTVAARTGSRYRQPVGCRLCFEEVVHVQLRLAACLRHRLAKRTGK